MTTKLLAIAPTVVGGTKLDCRAAEERGGDERLCPYSKHALISRQEHELWERQLRFAPSGRVIGIELEVALRMATAREFDIAVF